jgi:hypothetical protein
MMDRILSPARRNPWGKDPAMHEQLRVDRLSIYQRLAAMGAVDVDANRSVDEVVNAVLAVSDRD